MAPCTMIPWNNPDGSGNPWGGMCLEDVPPGQVLYNPAGAGATRHIAFAPTGPGAQPPGGGGAGGNTGGPSAAGPGYQQAFSNIPPVGQATVHGDPLVDYFTTGSPAGSAAPAGGLCAMAPGGPLGRAACEWLANQVGSRISNTPTTCKDPYIPDGKGGCKHKTGSMLPGDVGLPDTVWSPVAGRYGAGLSPMLVQRQVRMCPPDFVLGKDGVCYDRLPRTSRAHNPGARPLLTGGDMNALRKVGRLKKRWAKAAGAFHAKVVRQGARLKKAPK